jgi:[pyruvate, water dikinase]-phosphate phosphotransferase / [pyruvate, water dikinase] kinase
MSSPTGAKSLKIFILSGSTGRTCDEVLRSALAQFHEPRVQIVRRPHLGSEADVIREVQAAAEAGGAICHSLVVPELHEALLRETTRLHVPSIDILGPLLILLQDQLGQRPRGLAGLAFQTQRERLERIDAVNYTLAHDDGAGLAELDQADVVLVGASRVSKSVTCFYLAYEGIRAANVPLIPGLEPPSELLAVERSKVIGLTMNANRLQGLRQARIRRMGDGAFDKYGSLHEIDAELRQIEQLIGRCGWRRIDVSYMSVEEVAQEVMSLVRT